MFPSESLLYEGRARIHVRIIDFYLKSLQVKAFSSDSLVLMQIVSSLGFTADTMQKNDACQQCVAAMLGLV